MRSRRVTCDSCAVLVINGVICHEHGCPNARRGKVRKTREEIRVERVVDYKPGLGRFKP